MTMGITEVVRGNDILAATPRQIVLHERLQNPHPPAFGHVPLLLDAQGQRLAKRHESLQLRALRTAGVKASAVIGYLGWVAGLVETPRLLTLATLLDVYKDYVPSLAVRLPNDLTEKLLRL